MAAKADSAVAAAAADSAAAVATADFVVAAKADSAAVVLHRCRESAPGQRKKKKKLKLKLDPHPVADRRVTAAVKAAFPNLESRMNLCQTAAAAKKPMFAPAATAPMSEPAVRALMFEPGAATPMAAPGPACYGRGLRSYLPDGPLPF